MTNIVYRNGMTDGSTIDFTLPVIGLVSTNLNFKSVFVSFVCEGISILRL